MTAAFELAQTILNWDRILLTTHQRADGDALGAVLAMAIALKQMGKSFTIVLDDKQPDPKYRFLPLFDTIVGWSDDLSPHLFDYAIILDAPTPERIGAVKKLLPLFERRAVIDHHENQAPFAQYPLINVNASSSCELLIDVLKALPIVIDLRLATCIYTGIVFDTSQFRFSNATPNSFRIAANMVDLGVHPEEIAMHVFFRKTFPALKLLGSALDSLQRFHNDRIVVLHLRFSSIEQHQGSWNDLEGFIDYAISLDGAEIAIFIKESQPHTYKVSLRSNNHINVSLLAESFGGGGHVKAAGYTTHGEFTDILNEVVQKVINLF